MARTIRIALVFGSKAIRDGRRLLLSTQPDFDVVYEGSDAAQSLLQLADAAVDVVLVDNRLRGSSGTDLIAKFIRRNLEEGVKLPAFVLTGPFASVPMAIAAVRCGADDLVTEDEGPELLIDAIRNSATQPTIVDMDDLRALFEEAGVEHEGNTRWLLRLTNLTDVEKQCLDHLRSGVEYDEIADVANIPVRTVREALNSIQLRLGLATREQLTLALYESGAIPK